MQCSFVFGTVVIWHSRCMQVDDRDWHFVDQVLSHDTNSRYRLWNAFAACKTSKVNTWTNCHTWVNLQQCGGVYAKLGKSSGICGHTTV